jgi:SPP1 gp7 family putative phage head morphogenesis protein
MDSQISRVLAQGIADGDNPRLLGQKLVSVINGSGADKLGIKDTLGRFIPAERRAEMIARTEIIRAHHLATIQEYRNWGVAGVAVEAEWHTAGDSRVCAECAEMEGHVFTLDEIEPMIPLHPQCRCNTLPVKVREWKKGIKPITIPTETEWIIQDNVKDIEDQLKEKLAVQRLFTSANITTKAAIARANMAGEVLLKEIYNTLPKLTKAGLGQRVSS